MLEMPASIMERLSIILHYEKDAFASIILKEGCHETKKIHQKPRIRSTGRT
jgi:hypothetical protein